MTLNTNRVPHTQKNKINKFAGINNKIYRKHVVAKFKLSMNVCMNTKKKQNL